MQQTILKVEQLLATIFALFFMLASVFIFGFALVQVGQAFVGDKAGVDPLLMAVALVAVAVAVLELGATILDDQMARNSPTRETYEIRHTLSRFLYIVITALAIEGLLMVFKYSLSDQPSQLIFAASIIVATSILLLSSAVYNRFSVAVEVEEATNPAVNGANDTGSPAQADAQN